MSLTRRQREILDFISHFLEEHRYAPSLGEIGRAFGLSSPATIHKHLSRLEAKGKIRRLPNQSRSVELLPEKATGGTVELPLLGRVAAGHPIEAIEDPQTVTVPDWLAKRPDSFVLQVLGDSMIDEQVREGDYIVLEGRQEARDGEMVVALLRGQEVTLKRLYRDGDKVRLQPAHEAFPPLILSPEEVAVQGVVVGLFRLY